MTIATPASHAVTLRVRTKRTRRVWGLLIAIALIYLFAMNSLIVWLYMIVAMLLALLPIGLAGPLLAFRRRPQINTAHASGIGWTPPLVDDRNKLFVFGTRVATLLPGFNHDRIDIEALILDNGERIPVRMEMNEQQELTVLCDMPKRCARTVAGYALASSWPLGLWRLEMDLPAPQLLPLVVNPRYLLVAPKQKGGGGIGGEDTGRRGHGDDVIGLRQYQPSDNRRDIHWMTTARTGELMVVERAAPALAAMRISLRFDADADPGAVELAVFLAATLCASCTNLGRPFRLSLPDDQPEARFWAEALLRMARVETRVVPPSHHPVTAAIRAKSNGVLLQSESGEVILPPEAPSSTVEDIVGGLL